MSNEIEVGTVVQLSEHRIYCVTVQETRETAGVKWAKIWTPPGMRTPIGWVRCSEIVPEWTSVDVTDNIEGPWIRLVSAGRRAATTESETSMSTEEILEDCQDSMEERIITAIMAKDKNKELGLRAVACKHWQWLPGMLAIYGGEKVRIAFYTQSLSSYYWPDFQDSKTFDMLLELVRRKYGGTSFEDYIEVAADGCSRLEVYVLALEHCPKPVTETPRETAPESETPIPTGQESMKLVPMKSVPISDVVERRILHKKLRLLKYTGRTKGKIWLRIKIAVDDELQLHDIPLGQRVSGYLSISLIPKEEATTEGKLWLQVKITVDDEVQLHEIPLGQAVQRYMSTEWICKEDGTTESETPMSTEQEAKNEEFKELGLRAVACKHWQWLPGMRALHDSGAGLRMVTTRAKLDDCWPDFEDSKTFDLLVDVVRQAWDDPDAGFTNFHEDGPPWYLASSRRIASQWEFEFKGNSRPEACVRALEYCTKPVTETPREVAPEREKPMPTEEEKERASRELKELGLRAVACRHWQWLSGMQAVNGDGNPVRVTLLESWSIPSLEGYWPDLQDFDTCGRMLALVRHVWGNPDADFSDSDPRRFEASRSHTFEARQYTSTIERHTAEIAVYVRALEHCTFFSAEEDTTESETSMPTEQDDKTRILVASHADIDEATARINAIEDEQDQLDRRLGALERPPEEPDTASGKKIRVIVESPLAADTDEQIEKNMAYARDCMLDCLLRNEAPSVSHLLYTQVLDDKKPAHREIGIEAGLAWGDVADMTVVYIDYGVSKGMKKGIDHAYAEGRFVAFRRLGVE